MRHRPRRWNSRWRSAARRGLLAAWLASLFALIAPLAALGQPPATNPFSPALPISPAPTSTAATQTQTVVPSTTSTTGGSLSGGSVAAIAVGAIVLLVGISLFIWRDARRRAPVRRRAATGAVDGGRARARQRAKPRKLSPAERRRRKRGRAR